MNCLKVVVFLSTFLSVYQPSYGTYSECTELNVTLVGHNFVRFQGDLLEYSARKISRVNHEPWLILGPTLMSFQNLEGLTDVELRKSQGFDYGALYLVCGKSSSCGECIVVHYCDCDCNKDEYRLYEGVFGYKQYAEHRFGPYPHLYIEAKGVYPEKPLDQHLSVKFFPRECPEYPGPDCPSWTPPEFSLSVPDTPRTTLTAAGHVPEGVDKFTAVLEWSLRTEQLSWYNPEAIEGMNIPDAQIFTFEMYRFGKEDFQSYSIPEITIPFQNPQQNSREEIRRICEKIENE